MDIVNSYLLFGIHKHSCRSLFFGHHQINTHHQWVARRNLSLKNRDDEKRKWPQPKREKERERNAIRWIININLPRKMTFWTLWRAEREDMSCCRLSKSPKCTQWVCWNVVLSHIAIKWNGNSKYAKRWRAILLRMFEWILVMLYDQIFLNYFISGFLHTLFFCCQGSWRWCKKLKRYQRNTKENFNFPHVRSEIVLVISKYFVSFW